MESCSTVDNRDLGAALLGHFEYNMCLSWIMGTVKPPINAPSNERPPP